MFFDQATVDKERIKAMAMYEAWRERISDPSFAEMFTGQEWSIWKGHYTRKSKCGNYRLTVLTDRVRVTQIYHARVQSN